MNTQRWTTWLAGVLVIVGVIMLGKLGNPFPVRIGGVSAVAQLETEPPEPPPPTPATPIGRWQLDVDSMMRAMGTDDVDIASMLDLQMVFRLQDDGVGTVEVRIDDVEQIQEKSLVWTWDGERHLTLTVEGQEVTAEMVSDDRIGVYAPELDGPLYFDRL